MSIDFSNIDNIQINSVPTAELPEFLDELVWRQKYRQDLLNNSLNPEHQFPQDIIWYSERVDSIERKIEEVLLRI